MVTVREILLGAVLGVVLGVCVIGVQSGFSSQFGPTAQRPNTQFSSTQQHPSPFEPSPQKPPKNPKPEDNVSCKCPKVIDDGFYPRNFTPQPNKDQDIADKCIKIDNCDKERHSRYRTYDGKCNNLNFPMWGMKDSGLLRLLAPQYADGKRTHRRAQDGGELPNARLCRTQILKDKIILNKKISYLFVVFAQWISHDTCITSEASGNLANCCDGNDWPKEMPANCTSTKVLPDDEEYGPQGVKCLPRIRSQTMQDLGCDLPFLQQLTSLSHFMDHSVMYGSTKNDSMFLREMKGGRLRETIIDHQKFPPNLKNPHSVCDLHKDDPHYCCITGDFRTNENPPFTALATMWWRFHNDCADILSKINPHWDDDTTYEECRRITIASYHFITRKEFLHLLVGPEFVKAAGLNFKNTEPDKLYDPFLNPTSINEFLMAAYRGGHSMILEVLKLHMHNNETEHMRINNFLNRPMHVVKSYGPLVESTCDSPMAKQDKFGSKDMNNKLFHSVRAVGGDLDTTSIERERESGLGGWCHYIHKLLGQDKIESWRDLEKYFAPDTIRDFRKVYKHWLDIDLYVGCVAECPVGNSMFGKVCTAIIIEQFKRWLIGDRYHPTCDGQPGLFPNHQLKELNKMDMAYILCHYGDMTEVREKPFLMGGKKKECSSMPKVDWNAWKALANETSQKS
nr:PREDICTED: peroxidase-like [Bemisia tabaci]